MKASSRFVCVWVKELDKKMFATGEYIINYCRYNYIDVYTNWSEFLPFNSFSKHLTIDGIRKINEEMWQRISNNIMANVMKH